MDRDAIRRLAYKSNRQERRKADKLIRVSKILKPGIVFNTGTGRVNRVLEVNESYLYLKASNGFKIVRIPAQKIKIMLTYFFRVRLVERKELEVFHSYTSALFGLLAAIFQEKVKVSRSGKLLRLIMVGLRMFLAGGERSPKDLVMAAQAGIGYILFSYYYIRKGKAWLRYLIENKLRMILDPGKYTEWSAKHKGKLSESLNIDSYIGFIKTYSDLIEHYFVFDEIGNHEQTMKNLMYMESQGLSPVPIFHLGTPMEVLDGLVEKGYPVIGLGGTVNQRGVKGFLQEVFNRHPGVAFHGLGISKADIILSFPFFSCDSTAWLYCRRSDKAIVLCKSGQVKRIDLSTMERVNRSFKFLKFLESPRYFRGTTLVGEQMRMFA